MVASGKRPVVVRVCVSQISNLRYETSNRTPKKIESLIYKE